MGFSNAIFNKKGRWHWAHDDSDIAVSLKPKGLKQTWYIAELFIPDFPNYDTRIHKQEIERHLSKSDELVEFEITEKLKEDIHNLHERAQI